MGGLGGAIDQKYGAGGLLHVIFTNHTDTQIRDRNPTKS